MSALLPLPYHTPKKMCDKFKCNRAGEKNHMSRKHILPVDVVLGGLLNKTDTFEYIRDVVYPTFLDALLLSALS